MLPEEEEEAKLITIGAPPPTPLVWDFQVSDEDESYEPKGKIVEKEGIEFYLTGAKGEVGLLIFSDYWGYNSGRVRALADHLSGSVNAYVAIPKLLCDPPFEEGTDGDGLPPDFDNPEARWDEVKRWLMQYLWAKFENIVKLTVGHLRQDGVKRIGGVGFGFGTWILCYTSVLCKDMLGASMFYPLAGHIEEMNGGDPFVMASRVGCPVLFMLCQSCTDTYLPNGEIYEAIRRRNEESVIEQFKEVPHGWMTRGSLKESGIKEGIETAMMVLQKFLRNKLWPLPLGADIDTLRQACQDADNDLIEELMKLQVPIAGKDAMDRCGLSPIHYAATAGNAQPIRLLVKGDADVNVTGGARNETALHCASKSGRKNASSALILLKAEVHALDKGEQTPLHAASWKGHEAVVRILVKAQADLDRKDTAGQTPLHLAAWHAQVGIVQFFLSLKCAIDTEDLRGQTPYMRAVQGGAAEVADVLDLERERREAIEKAERLRIEAERARIEEEKRKEEARRIAEAREAGIEIDPSTGETGEEGEAPKPKKNAAKSKLAGLIGGAKLD